MSRARHGRTPRTRGRRRADDQVVGHDRRRVLADRRAHRARGGRRTRRSKPSASVCSRRRGDHPLGTDALSRDVFTRTLYGARQTLPISLIVIVSAVSIGSALGAIAGLRRRLGRPGWSCVSSTSRSPSHRSSWRWRSTPPSARVSSNACIAMIIVWWPIYARLIRGQVHVGQASRAHPSGGVDRGDAWTHPAQARRCRCRSRRR